jgi:hypothetical protein
VSETENGETENGIRTENGVDGKRWENGVTENGVRYHFEVFFP